MLDILTIGSAVVDVYIHSEEFKLEKRSEGVFLCQQFGDKIAIDKFELMVGGGAANTAVSFSRLGFDVGIVAEFGHDDWAGIIKRRLRAESVNCRYIITEQKEKTGGSVIMIGPGGGRTAMVSRGAAGMLDPKDIPTRTLSRVEWIHLSSIAGKLSTLKTIFAAVKDNRLSWNPGKLELLLLAEGRLKLRDVRCSVLSLNVQEWQMISGLQSSMLQTIPEIIVTDGKKGGVLYLNGEQHTFTALSRSAVDETGAGDAFVSGYVAARRHNLPVLRALRWGRKNAASVVGHIGSQPGLLHKGSLVTTAKMA